MNTNWKIEFEVTGKYLSDAQGAVHQLRGVSNIGVRPIAESKPRTNGSGKAIVEVILNYLQEHPSMVIDAQKATEIAIAAGINTDVKKMSSNLSNMKVRGLLNRVATGRYRKKAKK